MKFIFFTLVFAFHVGAVFAQKSDEILATAKGVTFTANSLSDNARKAYLGQNAAVAIERTNLFSSLVRETLFDAEAKAQGITGDALLAAEKKKLAEPTSAEIKTVFDANRAAFGDKTVEQARPQIAAFLRNGSEKKTVADLTERLKVKHKFAPGKDINATDLKAADTIFTVAGKIVASGEFDARFKPHLYDVRSGMVSQVLLDLENSILSTVLTLEAKERNIETGDLIAAEVTNKLRDFTDEERLNLQNALQTKLFEKYAVKILLREPDPVAHNVSADDDPVSGKAAAPVTVIMFSDFQCSACSATHPVLKKVIGEYGDKVRLVVRDFPLEPVHEHAFNAALAAHAAGKQGKFFEYIEVLYRNQTDLDPASLKKYAAELGLNLKQFELDLSDEKTASEVRKDMADGMNLGIRGTPTIFINGVKSSRLSAEGFKSAIDSALINKK